MLERKVYYCFDVLAQAFSRVHLLLFLSLMIFFFFLFIYLFPVDHTRLLIYRFIMRFKCSGNAPLAVLYTMYCTILTPLDF